MTHGQTGGKLQTTEKLIKSGKNAGKSNETSPYTQGLSEADSSFSKKMDQGYVEHASGRSNIIRPMLAKDFSKQKHHIKYPAYVQHKLNGVRCLAYLENGEVQLMSRYGKSYNDNIVEIRDALKTVLTDGIILDGEIYMHGWTFQNIIRGVRKRDAFLSPKLQYHIYDIDTPENLTFSERRHLIPQVLKYLSKRRFKRVVAIPVNNEEEVKIYRKIFMGDGYEGVIIRNGKGRYERGVRSNHLQKYKEFTDQEFEIVGHKVGIGTEAGCVVWEVRTASGKTFWVRPRGSHEERRALARMAKRCYGQQLTVRYQELSEEGIPVFPVGIAIRDYE